MKVSQLPNRGDMLRKLKVVTAESSSEGDKSVSLTLHNRCSSKIACAGWGTDSARGYYVAVAEAPELYRRQTGIDRVPLNPERMRSWREQIGYVAQDTFL